MAAMSASFRISTSLVVLGAFLFAGESVPAAPADEYLEAGAAWLAGDHHVHTEHSVEWDKNADPPSPILGGDARYSIEHLARKARHFELDWIAVTDHGGPLHSDYARTKGWDALDSARRAVPDLIQFHGIELDVPGAKHATVIMPHGPDEAEDLAVFERRFARKDAWPEEKSRDRESLMLEALAFAASMPRPPLIIANHPARSAAGPGRFTDVTPDELRNWQDAAPGVVIGMEGAPGHQAMALKKALSPQARGRRGDYDHYPTMGGFDLFTAKLGGVWDAFLGEGRAFWITASSDSHIHVSHGGGDFWPGEYSKTYVLAQKSPNAILAALKAGRVFVATGDLISALEITASVQGLPVRSGMGGTLAVHPGERVRFSIRFRDPTTPNVHGDSPQVRRVDLIAGDIGATQGDTNPSTHVAARFASPDWKRDGDWRSFSWTSPPVQKDFYLRLRGTGSDELEPAADQIDEDPWTDLWFYGNPIFIRLAQPEKSNRS